jgi:hypothetical protein
LSFAPTNISTKSSFVQTNVSANGERALRKELITQKKITLQIRDVHADDVWDPDPLPGVGEADTEEIKVRPEDVECPRKGAEHQVRAILERAWLQLKNDFSLGKLEASAIPNRDTPPHVPDYSKAMPIPLHFWKQEHLTTDGLNKPHPFGTSLGLHLVRISKEELRKYLHPEKQSIQAHVRHSIIRSIQWCRPYSRCESGACPECTRALQRWFVENMRNATATSLESNKELIRLSLVPDYASTFAMHPTMGWENVIARLCHDMASVGIPWAIGGSDFSVNIDKVNGGKPILQGQLWLFLEKPEGHWERKRKALINSSGAIKRPFQKLEYIGSHAKLAYGIKNDFNQRNSYLTITDGTPV